MQLDQGVKEHFVSLSPLRVLSSHLDPSTTAVVTYSNLLNEAVMRCLGMKLPKLPDFVLIDQVADEGDIHKELTLESGEHFRFRIVPANQMGILGDVDFCLYASGLDGEHSLWKLYECWQAVGKSDTVLMDIKPLIRYPVTRPPLIGFLGSRFEDICSVYGALSDDESRDVFLRCIKCVETGDPGYLRLSQYPHYHHPKVHAMKGDCVVEGGLADGTTTEQFARQVGESGKVIGFEPLSQYYEQTRQRLDTFNNVIIEKYGLWSGPGSFHIENKNEESCVIPEATATSEECFCVSLDAYLSERNERCDLLKLDIEGAEVECLKGAMDTIRKYRPKLQISIYHHRDHYIDIPLMLIREDLGYDFYMGHHVPWFNETVLYAIPGESIE